MNFFISTISSNISIIQNAPLAFAIFLMVGAGVGWWAGRALSLREIQNLKSEIELRKSTLEHVEKTSSGKKGEIIRDENASLLIDKIVNNLTTVAHNSSVMAGLFFSGWYDFNNDDPKVIQQEINTALKIVSLIASGTKFDFGHLSNDDLKEYIEIQHEILMNYGCGYLPKNFDFGDNYDPDSGDNQRHAWFYDKQRESTEEFIKIINNKDNYKNSKYYKERHDR